VQILRGLEAAGLSINEHLDHINLADQGFAIVEVTPELLRVEFKVLDTFAENPEVTVAWSYEVPRGTTPSECPAKVPVDPMPPAPPKPVPPKFVG
jgi:alkaline phosphatase D